MQQVEGGFALVAQQWGVVGDPVARLDAHMVLASDASRRFRSPRHAGSGCWTGQFAYLGGGVPLHPVHARLPVLPELLRKCVLLDSRA